MTKIVHVSAQDPNHSTGGQGIVIQQICQALIKKKIPIDYLSLRLAGESEKQDFHYPAGVLSVRRFSVSDSDQIVTPYSGNEIIQLSRRLEFNTLVARFIRETYSPKDIVLHLHGFYAEPLLAGILQEYRSVSTYHLLLSPRMEHTGENTDILFDLIRQFEVASFYSSKKIQAISPGMTTEILRVAKSLKDPYFKQAVMRIMKTFAIDTTLLEQEKPDFDGLRERLVMIPHGGSDIFFDEPSAKPKPNTVVGWGRITNEKGFEHFIEAAAELPNLTFKLFGTTGDSERIRREHRLRLEKMAEPLPNIMLDFRPGGIRGQELIDKIDEAEIVVMPSLYEPFGLVTIEAMARKKPIITTTTTGGCYIMGADQPSRFPYGYLVTNSAATLTSEIIQSLKEFFSKSPDERAKMGTAASRHVQNYRWDRKIEELLELYSL